MIKKIISYIGLASILFGCEATSDNKINITVNEKNKPKNVLFYHTENSYNWGWDLNNDGVMDESLHTQNITKYFKENINAKTPTKIIKEMNKFDWWHLVAKDVKPEQQYINTTENTMPMHELVRKLMTHVNTLPERKDIHVKQSLPGQFGINSFIVKEGRYKLDSIE